MSGSNRSWPSPVLPLLLECQDEADATLGGWQIIAGCKIRDLLSEQPAASTQRLLRQNLSTGANPLPVTERPSSIQCHCGVSLLLWQRQRSQFSSSKNQPG